MVKESVGPLLLIYHRTYLFNVASHRTDPHSLIPMPKTVPTKPYDWTYTTTYPGHLFQSGTITWTPADLHNPSHRIPLSELTRPDPILFYAEVPLFEDELHDNGSSNLLARIVRTSLHVVSSLRHPYPSFYSARNADLFVYSFPVHTPCRQCSISNTRYSCIPFIFVRPPSGCTGNQWLGSSLRYSQKGVCVSLCILFITFVHDVHLLATSQERRLNTTHRSYIHSEGLD